MCGTAVSASASECPGCGEQFAPVEEETATEQPEEGVCPGCGAYVEAGAEVCLLCDSPLVAPEPEEPVPEVAGELAVQEAEEAPEPEFGACKDCDSPLDEQGRCPDCQPTVTADKSSKGCPLCASLNYSVESGDLVSCIECGNVYVRKDFEPEAQNWKWKFWVGLVFILVGNLGMALFSYVHNVIQWSPLGDMYLGYGRIDRMLGAVGVILFLLGLLLFAWSFKREREIECPSCKVVIREGQFEIYEPPEEEEAVPEEAAVKSALDEIGETAECPSCGASVSIFDASCGSCGAVFETEFGEPGTEEPAPEEPTEPGRLLSASEIDEHEMIMESLELETPEEEGNGLKALDELESTFEISMEDGITCPTCGARVGKGLDTCPGCGEKLNGGE